MKNVWRICLAIILLFSFALPASAKTERTWQDERIYFIMVDRFNNGNPKNDYAVDVHDPKAYHGGDLQGVIDKLDYKIGRAHV